MDVAEVIFIDSALIVIVIIILMGSSWSHVCYQVTVSKDDGQKLPTSSASSLRGV